MPLDDVNSSSPTYTDQATEEDVWRWWRSVTYHPQDIVHNIDFTEFPKHTIYEIIEKHTLYGICFSLKITTPMKSKEAAVLEVDFSTIKSRTRSMALFIHDEHDEIGNRIVRTIYL